MTRYWFDCAKHDYRKAIIIVIKRWNLYFDVDKSEVSSVCAPWLDVNYLR